MPFDGLTSDQYDRVSLFQQRREKAWELLSITPHEQFDLTGWDNCGMGCLARAHHDGWSFSIEGVQWNGHSNFNAAVAYFGLSFFDAVAVFGGNGSEALYLKNDERVTPDDVGAMLMSMPVYVV